MLSQMLFSCTYGEKRTFYPREIFKCWQVWLWRNNIVTAIEQGYRVNSKFDHICERYSPLKYACPRFDLSSTKFERNPVAAVRVTAPSVFRQVPGSKLRQATILNDTKNLYDVHNPQTISDLGVTFQTIWSIHFWEITVLGSRYICTDVQMEPKL